MRNNGDSKQRVLFIFGAGASYDDGALEILKQRYARGEIGKDEFEKMKKDL
jgi:uncharacterized membrane protein